MKNISIDEISIETFFKFNINSRQDAVGAYIWAWSYYGCDTLNMPYCS